MKTKLLKKLRKKYPVEIRNGKYRVNQLGHDLYVTGYTSKENALEVRRKCILDAAQKYIRPKGYLK